MHMFINISTNDITVCLLLTGRPSNTTATTTNSTTTTNKSNNKRGF